MDRKQDLFNYASLALFGRVNASISHELKNIMAIISETAGLLGDLSEMAKGGAGIDPDMLISSIDSIAEEIERGFTTIRQMNRFSHSVDVPIGSIDLMEVLDLVGQLCGYLAFAGKMRIHPCKDTAPIVQTSPFILQAVIYQTVAGIFQKTGPDKELNVSVQPRDDASWQMLFDGAGITAVEMPGGDGIERMAASIGVAIHWEPAEDCLEMKIPFSI